MKITPKGFKAISKLAKSDDRYDIYDLALDKHTLSMTMLHPGKETRGHAHGGIEEIYFFLSGHGKMQEGEATFDVRGGSVVLIKKGVFHKVFNTSESDLKFVCFFEKYNRDQ